MDSFKKLSKSEFVSELPQFINNFLSIIESKFNSYDSIIDTARGIINLTGNSTMSLKKVVLNADIDDVLSILDKSNSQIASIDNLGNARFAKLVAGKGTTSVADGESYIDRLFCDSFKTRSFSSASFDIEQTLVTQYEVLNVTQNSGTDIHNKKSVLLLNYNSIISSGEKKLLINPATLKKGMHFTMHLFQCGESDICQIASSDPLRPIRLMNGKSTDVSIVFKGQRSDEPQFVELVYVDEKNYQGLVVYRHSGVTFRNNA